MSNLFYSSDALHHCHKIHYRYSIHRQMINSAFMFYFKNSIFYSKHFNVYRKCMLQSAHVSEHYNSLIHTYTLQHYSDNNNTPLFIQNLICVFIQTPVFSFKQFILKRNSSTMINISVINTQFFVNHQIELVMNCISY